MPRDFLRSFKQGGRLTKLRLSSDQAALLRLWFQLIELLLVKLFPRQVGFAKSTYVI